ncbi:hypothetical protein [Micromonospora sp. WMMD737]|uniref:hypothetical protein n=1 Tax=Micromonospora sp. WMMD737 TaxID=3404113 RepID=UPI003B966B60
MRKPTVLTLVVGLVAAVAAVGIMPRAPRLTGQSTGDTALAADVRAAVPDPEGHCGLAVAVLENGQVRTAGLGDRDLALGHRLGDWSVIPGWPWPVGAGLSAAGIVLAAYRWRGLPALAGAPPWRPWPS